jgi:hypothetical protein
VTTLVVVCLGLAAAYLVSCVLYPYRRCRICDGRGHHLSSFLRVIRPCARGEGTGCQLRTGRRAYDAWQRSRRRRH